MAVQLLVGMGDDPPIAVAAKAEKIKPEDAEENSKAATPITKMAAGRAAE